MSSKKEVSSLGDRLRQARLDLGLTLKKFSDPLGVSSNYIGQVERGKSGASRLFLRSVDREWKISASWLETGEGEMYVKPLRVAEPQAPYAHPRGRKILGLVQRIIESNEDMVIQALENNLEIFLQALGRQPRGRRRLGDILLGLGVVTPEQIKQALKEQTGE